ncbi:MAG TPA: ATP-binding protein, partial [Baekduia sp.]|nr:ATP-binding protein [Baekduia sp.]
GEGGFGLGLAIGRELARRLGGELALASQTTNGARFVLTLPIGMPRGSGDGAGDAAHADEAGDAPASSPSMPAAGSSRED